MKADRTLARLEDDIVQVLLKNARENGRHAGMRASEIGKEIGTYRTREESRSSDDPFGQAHDKLLRQLQNQGRIQALWNEAHTKRRWRLTDTELNRLPLGE